MENEKGLSRFKIAQDFDFETALAEINGGRKKSHWMWYVFPQLKGLGRSEMAEYYGIDGMEEAKAYLADNELRANLGIITKALLSLSGNNATVIFGVTDALKLKSCMTLFFLASEDAEIKGWFKSVLEKFYDGKLCERTKKMILGNN